MTQGFSRLIENDSEGFSVSANTNFKVDYPPFIFALQITYKLDSEY
jgi:hypothetical protein